MNALSKTCRPIPRNDLLAVYLSLRHLRESLLRLIDEENTHQDARWRRNRPRSFEAGEKTLTHYGKQLDLVDALLMEFYLLRDTQYPEAKPFTTRTLQGWEVSQP